MNRERGSESEQGVREQGVREGGREGVSGQGERE